MTNLSPKQARGKKQQMNANIPPRWNQWVNDVANEMDVQKQVVVMAALYLYSLTEQRKRNLTTHSMAVVAKLKYDTLCGMDPPDAAELVEAVGPGVAACLAQHDPPSKIAPAPKSRGRNA